MFETEADSRLKTVSALFWFDKVFQTQNWDRLQIKNLSHFQKKSIIANPNHQFLLLCTYSKLSFVVSLALKALWCHVFLISRINFPTTLLQYVNWHFWHFTGQGRRARYCSKFFVPAEHKTTHRTRAITSRSLNIYFLPHFSIRCASTGIFLLHQVVVSYEQSQQKLKLYYRIVASTNTCTYVITRVTIFCFLKSRILTCQFFFRNKTFSKRSDNFNFLTPHVTNWI